MSGRFLIRCVWIREGEGGCVLSYGEGKGAAMIRSVDWTMWVLLVAAATLEFAGDLAMKWWAETDRWPGLVGGLVIYGLALVLFAVLLRRAELAVIFVLWVGVAAVLLALAGWWLFGEALSLRQLAGLALVMGGIVLLGR